MSYVKHVTRWIEWMNWTKLNYTTLNYTKINQLVCVFTNEDKNELVNEERTLNNADANFMSHIRKN
jgi:hypothetical protein